MDRKQRLRKAHGPCNWSIEERLKKIWRLPLLDSESVSFGGFAGQSGTHRAGVTRFKRNDLRHTPRNQRLFRKDSRVCFISPGRAPRFVCTRRAICRTTTRCLGRTFMAGPAGICGFVNARCQSTGAFWKDRRRSLSIGASPKVVDSPTKRF